MYVVQSYSQFIILIIIIFSLTGIGYFTLPILVHSGAKLVYACEWNPAAIEGLRKGLIHNKVTDKCIILEGDNNQAGSNPPSPGFFPTFTRLFLC